jgi:hypothetical protein
MAKKNAGPDAALADIPSSAFQGGTVWQIRLLVEHKNGAVREARFKLNLG